MKTIISISEEKKVHINLNEPIPISIPIQNGENNPNCYWAEPVKFKTIKSGNFVGSVAEGGSVNYQQFIVTPHGNGTHTECYGHITNTRATVNKQLHNYHFLCNVISITPTLTKQGDLVLPLTNELADQDWNGVKALAIRTLPNPESKKLKQYSGTNPAYMSKELMHFIVEQNIHHLLIDLPSVDKEVDEGALTAHRIFWGLPNMPRKNATITELVFIPESVLDGLYLLNLQIINLAMDASPSHPVLYKIEKLGPHI